MSKKLETESEKRARLMAMFSGQTPTAATSTDQPALDDLIARIVMGEPPETMHITSEQMEHIFKRLGLELPTGMRTPNGTQLSTGDWQVLREQLSLKIEQEERGVSGNMPNSSMPSEQTEEEKAIERKILGNMSESSGRPTNAKSAGQGRPSPTSGQPGAVGGARSTPGKLPKGVPEGSLWRPEHMLFVAPDGKRYTDDGYPLPYENEPRPSSPGRKYLFIGGVADGAWHAVPEGEQRRTAAPPPGAMPMGFAGHRGETEPCDMRASNYMRIPFNVGGVETAYFAASELGSDINTISQVAYEMLLRGYRPHAYDDCGECQHRRQHDAIHKRER